MATLSFSLHVQIETTGFLRGGDLEQRGYLASSASFEDHRDRVITALHPVPEKTEVTLGPYTLPAATASAATSRSTSCNGRTRACRVWPNWTPRRRRISCDRRRPARSRSACTNCWPRRRPSRTCVRISSTRPSYKPTSTTQQARASRSIPPPNWRRSPPRRSRASPPCGWNCMGAQCRPPRHIPPRI